jgi:hypothetical protein
MFVFCMKFCFNIFSLHAKYSFLVIISPIFDRYYSVLMHIANIDFLQIFEDYTLQFRRDVRKNAFPQSFLIFSKRVSIARTIHYSFNNKRLPHQNG